MIPKDRLFQKKIIICCGSGGVGKTTTSAALAIQAASLGKKVIVLTIDPAKRLATSMGLDSLDHQPQPIQLPKSAKGTLHAMMLDTKNTFDRLILKYASSRTQANHILKNKLYQHMSTMISGSQEYMAMEKLHEIFHEHTHDLIVLDTPPTRHALDFLDAPQKMVQLTENSLLKWFLKPALFTHKSKFSLLGKGAEKIMSVFDRLAGISFLQDLSQMLILISEMLGGFHDRAEQVNQLLRTDQTGFVLVTSPSPIHVEDAIYFHKKIREAGLPFLGAILNRCHSFSVSINQIVRQFPDHLRQPVQEILMNYHRLSHQDQGALKQLTEEIKTPQTFIKMVPRLAEDIHDMNGLMGFNKLLFG